MKSVSFCSTTCRRVTLTGRKERHGVDIPVSEHSIPALLWWCRDATLRRGEGCGSGAACRPESSFPTHPPVREQLLPFLGLSWVFSERCWPLSPQSAPFPNSAQPSCSVDQPSDAGRKEIKAITIRRTATASVEANASMSSGEIMVINVIMWCYDVSLGGCVCRRLSCVLGYWAAVCASVTEEDAVRGS